MNYTELYAKMDEELGKLIKTNSQLVNMRNMKSACTIADSSDGDNKSIRVTFIITGNITVIQIVKRIIDTNCQKENFSVDYTNISGKIFDYVA